MNKNLVFFIIILTAILILINNQSIKENFRPWKYDIFNRDRVNKTKSDKLVLPEGNWKDSCQVIDYRPPIIWADCKNYYGVYKITSKNISSCIAKNLSNIDGELQCDNI